MAQFPKFITPPTPGGIQAFGLQQKPLDLTPLLRSAAQKKSTPSTRRKSGGGVKSELLEGRIGAVQQYYQNVNAATNDIATLESTYGEIAHLLPEYQQATQELNHYTSPEYQNIIARETKEFDDYSKIVTDNKGGHMYHLGEWQRTQGRNTATHRALLKQQEYGLTDNLPNVYGDKVKTAQGIHGAPNYDRELDLDPNFYSRKDAIMELDRIFNPANDQMTDKASATVAGKIVKGVFNDITGVMTKHQKDSTDKQQLGFAAGEAGARFNQGKMDLSDPLVSGYLQAFLQVSGGGQVFNGKKLKNKDGSMNKEFYNEFLNYVGRDIKTHWDKRITTAKDRRKSFQEQSDFAYNQGIANKQITEVINSGFTEPTTTVLGETGGKIHTTLSPTVIGDIEKFYGGGKDPYLGEDALLKKIINEKGEEITVATDRLFSQINKTISGKGVHGGMESLHPFINRIARSIKAQREGAVTKDINNSFKNINTYVYPMNVETSDKLNENFKGKEAKNIFQGVAVSVGVGSFHDSRVLDGTVFEGVSGDMTLSIRPMASNWNSATKQFEGVSGKEIGAAGYFAKGKGMLLNPHSEQSIEDLNNFMANNPNHDNISGMSHATYYQTATFTVPVNNEQKWFNKMKDVKIFTNDKSYAPKTMSKYSDKVKNVIKSASEYPATAGIGNLYRQGGTKSDLEKMSSKDYKNEYGVSKEEARQIIGILEQENVQKDEYGNLSDDFDNISRATVVYLDKLNMSSGVTDLKKIKTYALPQHAFKEGVSLDDVKTAITNDNLESVMHQLAIERMNPSIDEDGQIKFESQVDLSPLISRGGYGNTETRKILLDEQLRVSNEIVNGATEAEGTTGEMSEYFKKKVNRVDGIPTININPDIPLKE